MAGDVLAISEKEDDAGHSGVGDMKKRVTLKEVAQAVGVHFSTASRALDPKTRQMLNPKLVEEILKVSRELGYRQNAAAYSLKTNRTRTIGVVVPDITNPIFPPIIRGIEDALGEQGYLAILGNTDSNSERERELVDTFISRGIDGIILASVERVDEVVSQAQSEGTPIVTVNRRMEDATISSVVHDDDGGIRNMLTHLVSLGHRRIASIAGPQQLSTGAERHAAFLRHRDALKLETDEQLIVFANAYREADGERCVEELMARGVDFTAVVCANDRLAIGAITALNRRNLRCPDDISVTGYNDMPMVDKIAPPLTTIRIQQYEMGKQAGSVVCKMVEQGTDTEPSHITLPVELVVRSSTQAVSSPRSSK